MILRLLFAALFASALSACAGLEDLERLGELGETPPAGADPLQVAPKASPEAAYRPGQMWTLKAAPDGPARLIIGRVEPFGDQTAVHVSVVELAPDANGAGSLQGAGGARAGPAPAYTVTVPHRALALLDFEARAGEPVAVTGPVAGFAEAYAAWEAARGGLWEGE